MIISVTGANGHVGVNLCRKLAGLGHEVRAFVHDHDQALKGIPVTIYRGNLLEKDTLSQFVRDAGVIFHLAAKISINGDMDGSVYRLNTEGTRNLVVAALAAGTRRFIHFSSIHAFDQKPWDKTLDETRPLVGSRAFAYDRSKAEGEKIVLDAVTKGLDALILSPTAIIGPSDPEPGLMGQAFLQICRQEIPALVPGGYDMVDVRDVADAAVISMEKGRTGEKYLLSGKWHSIREIAMIIGELTGIRTVKTEMPFRVAYIGLPFISLYSKLTGNKPLYTSESLSILRSAHRDISHEKAGKEFGFSPRDIRDSMQDTIKWFIDNNYLKLRK